MPRRDDIQKILLIGSGPIVIGQAAEFDYSGVQACKVLLEEGFEVVLVNSNPATIMTDPEFATATYIEPLLPGPVTKIIEKERPDALLPTLGGQTALNLAMTLKQGGNLILLDEPTNDLDVETLGSLENALEQFPGCAVVISHDRWFLDRVVTHILAWEGTEANPAAWYWFEGNFDGYERNKIERLGLEAARPHRVTYRKLTRD